MTKREKAQVELKHILSDCHPSMIIPRLMAWHDTIEHDTAQACVEIAESYGCDGACGGTCISYQSTANAIRKKFSP